jgi:hypothetical protein
MSGVTINKVDDEALRLLKEAAAKFIKENSADVAVLGADAVKAIFAKKVSELVQPIPELPENATIEQIKERELICADRDSVIQLEALAYKQDADRVGRLRESAGKIASGLVKGVAGIAFGAAIKAIMGI